MVKKLWASICLLLCYGVYVESSLAQNVVTDWAEIIQPAVIKIDGQSTPRPPTSSEVLNTIIQLAMYDAAIAIEGGYTPYAASISAPPGADVRAAVATAAWRTARTRVASSQIPYLDTQYVAYMTNNIPDGQAKTDGIQVGESAAATMLGLRANDGFNNVVLYTCSSDPPPPGEFEPNAGCGTQPIDAKLAQVMPFTFSDQSQFRPDGPNTLTSEAYTEDFIETRDYGRSDSTFRSAEQTDIAYFYAEHAYVFYNRNLIGLAISRGLSVRETARLFAMVHCSVADATIAGFEAKYFFRSWRPRTAIPRADTDGNPDTDPDPSWTPLLTVNHPEYPSAHGFFSTALTDAVAAFFGTNKVTWTLTTSKTAVPQLVQNVRTYYDMNALMRDVDDARVWAGLHWRHSMHHGDQIGRKVARYVTENFFRPLP
jgi:VCPO second helical-bundle domain